VLVACNVLCRLTNQTQVTSVRIYFKAHPAAVGKAEKLLGQAASPFFDPTVGRNYLWPVQS